MKVFKQLLAVVISVAVATPGWANTDSSSWVTSALNAGEAAARTRAMPTAQAPSEQELAASANLTSPYNEEVKQCIIDKNISNRACNDAQAAAESKQLLIRDKMDETKTNTLNNLASDTGALFSQVGTERAFCHQTYVATCFSKCKEGVLTDPQKVPGYDDPTKQGKINADYATAKTEVKNAYDSCTAIELAVRTKIESNMVALANANASAKKGMSALMAGGLGLAAGVGGMMLLKGGGKDKEKKKEEEEAAKAKAANGVIKDANGNEITCFSQESYTRPECKSTLISLCQGEKSNTAGCRAFEAAYCANEGSGSGYCLYAEAKVYCAQTGDMIAQSPACTWKSSRPAACTTNPEDVSCLVSGTPEALTLSCANYPNDPLCKANAAGRVVVQGGGTSGGSANVGDGADGTTSPISTTSRLAASSVGSSSMSSVLGSRGAATLANNAPNAGLQVIAGDNMWSTSSSAVRKACASGQLLNCL